MAEASPPGLRFAILLDHSGGCRELTWPEVRTWTPADGFLWLHMERDTDLARTWLAESSGIDPLVVLALLADESRPRVEPVGDDLLVVLRGVAAPEHRVEPELMPLHIWAQSTRLISLRDHDDDYSVLRSLSVALLGGRGPRSPGVLLAAIAERAMEQLDTVIDDLEEDLDDLEDRVLSRERVSLRAELSQMRRRVIYIRRYLGPQREALYRLYHDDASWLTDPARQRLRELIDRLQRHIEDLDTLHDRAAVLHEDLSAQVSEMVAATSNRLTAVAAMLLPPSLLAAILGANVGGIPGQDSPMAFWILCAATVAMLAVVFVVLKRKNWF